MNVQVKTRWYGTEKLRKGEPMEKEEFTQLVLQSEATLFHVSFGLLHNEQDCADVVQEAVVKAWTNRHKLREKQYFKTWIVRIVLNECYTFLRSRKKSLLFYEENYVEEASDSEDYASGYSFVKEEYLDLYKAIDSLQNKDKICVQLFYMEDYSVAQIARVLKVPEGTVKSRLRRARLQLKEFLQD